MYVLLSSYLCFEIMLLILYWIFSVLHLHSSGVILLYVYLSESCSSKSSWVYLSRLMMVAPDFLY